MKWWLASIAFLFLLYAPSFSEPFFEIDDNRLIGAPQVQILDWQSVHSILTFGNHVDYYPVRDFTYLFDWQWGNDLANNGTPYRVQNLFWLVACSVALYFLLLKVGAPPRGAQAASLLWLLTPFHAELIVWGSSRKDLLALFGALLSANFILKIISNHHSKAMDYFLFFLGFLISIFSKATFIFWPIAIFLFCIREKSLSQRKPLLLATAVCSLISIFMIFLQMYVYGSINPMQVHLGFWVRLQSLLAAVGRAFIGVFAPTANAIDTENWGNWLQHNQGYIPVGLVAFVLLINFCVWFFKKEKTQSLLFISLLFGLFASTPGFNPLHRGFYSIRYYEPIFLLCFIAFNYSFFKFFSPYFPTSGKKMFLAFFALCTLALTYMEAKNWETNLQIASKGLNISPENISLQRLKLDTLLNLDRWGRLNSDEKMEMTRIYESLAEKCVSRKTDIDGLCFSFLKNLSAYQERFQNTPGAPAEANLENLTSAPEQSSEKLTFQKVYDQPQLLKDWQSRQRYFPVPEYRLWKLLALCQSEGQDAARKQTEIWLQEHLLSKNFIVEATASEKATSVKKWVLDCTRVTGAY